MKKLFLKIKDKFLEKKIDNSLHVLLSQNREFKKPIRKVGFIIDSELDIDYLDIVSLTENIGLKEKDIKVVSYSKPVFYAVSEDQILLLNQPVYPTPFDACNAINPELNEPCTHHTTERDFTTKKVGEVFLADSYLNNEWPTAQKRDTAVVNLIDFGNQVIQKVKYVKVENNLTTGGSINYGNWERVEEE